MKKIFILALLSGFFLCSCSAKKNETVAKLSVTEELKSFISKQKNGASKTFKYSGTIKNDDWKQIAKLINGCSCDLFLDFSEATCSKNDMKSYIPSDCFKSTARLTGIKLPDGLEEIYNNNFCDCTDLKSLYFPKNTVIKFIGYGVLTRVHNLEEIHLYNYSGLITSSFLHHLGKLKLLEMPEYPVRMERNKDDFKEDDFGSIKFVQMGKKKVPFDEWFELCKSVEPKDVAIASAKASSCAAEKYSADKLIDDSWTSWVEGKDDEGIGETIELTLSEPTSIACLELKNGFGNFDYYLSNNRVKQLEITLDDMAETTAVYDIADYPFFQTIPIFNYKKAYSKIKLTIKNVYKGTGADNDTCISEIRVNNYFKGYEMDPGYKRLKSTLSSLEHGYEYRFYPVSDGRHIMAVNHYDEENYETKEFAGFFIYDNGKWKSVYGEALGFEKTSAPSSIQSVINLIEELKTRNIKYNLRNSRNNKIMIYPFKEKLKFEFICKEDGFSENEKTPFSVLCNGTPEELQKYGNWKKILYDDAGGNYNFLVYAAIFNTNPSMIQYLVENGYSPNEYYSEGDALKITPFEASIKYNNQITKAALISLGASYREELLIDAFIKGNLIEVNNLVQCYADVSFILGHCNTALYRWREFGVGEPLIPHMEKFLNILKSRNVDFSQIVGDEKGRETSLLDQALRYGPKFLNLVLLYDWKIKGNEIADYIYDSRYHDDRKEFISVLEKLDRKSPFKDLSEDQKTNITFKIAYDAYSIDEIKFFADRNALSFKTKDIYLAGNINVIENLMYDLRKDNDHDEVIKFLIESGADVNQTFVKGGKTNTLMGTMMRSIYYNSVYCEKHYKLFEYLYKKGGRPSYEELNYYVVGYGLDSPYDFTDEDFEMRFNYIYKTLFHDYSGKIISEGKTLAQLVIEKLGENYIDDIMLGKLEVKLRWMVSELKAAGCAEDWKKECFEKAGFSKEFSERVGI
ncbi:NADase-type glycan-binding domain-containing protein [Treponema sp.]|uniref:NADase-type glycan-binding domain-containing protein n=1 Tax=Treponema sp. TaxID=166 RepID=UPI00298E2CA0|nr:leucine-rich repeat protein [Treponema sp.]MCQ2240385.1 leucine-rich repeat domain-containing protein [Treponema sp.]